jgi:glycosyltransferase involved in cell wall biosynthesis
MHWTIGMPSFNNTDEVFWTVTSLLEMHRDVDKEIIVIDNYGSESLAKFCNTISKKHNVHYFRHNEVQGVSYAKNKIFEHAKGEFVLCIDSHIIVRKGAFDIDPPGDDLVQGPIICSDYVNYICTWKPIWRSQMWGIWGDKSEMLPVDPFEIWGMGAGFFACRRSSWLKFHSGFRGFGGETGYIQEKYRKAGRKVWCYPNMIWKHKFYDQTTSKIPYRVDLLDRVRNYLIGFEEIGLDTQPIVEHFGLETVLKARAK